MERKSLKIPMDKSEKGYVEQKCMKNTHGQDEKRVCGAEMHEKYPRAR